MRRTNETIWLLVWLLLTVAGGCTETEVEEEDIPPHALKEVEAGFNLNVLASRTPVTRSIIFTPNGTVESDTLAVAGVADTLQTRATTALEADRENLIANLWVGQYNATTGVRLFNQYFESMTGTTVNLKLKQIQDESNSHVYFISNAGDLGEIVDEATLKIHALPYTFTDEGLPNDNLCRMVGMWEGKVVATGMKDIEVELTRLLAKITFTYSMGEGFTFTPISVALRSVPDKSQVTAPTTQLSGLSYGTYSGTASADGATIYWYLPENMAGTVSGPDAVDSEKKKTGTGVTNATCIELTGTAVQGGVRYEEVTFRFYPGSSMNNYDIIRNSHYTMSVTLVGIDVSDERITVGKIPPIIVDEGKMPAEKGGTKEVQITARPGQPWSFDMPQWLSALLDGTAVSAGATFSYHGPYKVIFQAASANPEAEDRSVTFSLKVNGVDQDITLTQSGSTLTKGEDISLEAASGSEGSSSFTATSGLQWSAALRDGEWLDWATANPATSGAEAPAEAQTLVVRAKTSNPSATERIGKITVKAGASVGNVSYTGLKQDINVTQAGSTVTGSSKEVNAEAATGLTSSFTATAGLNWAASVTDGSWITLAESSGGPTTGSAENINYNVPVNPNAESRSDEITVRAGDPSTGPTAKITVSQKASSLTASGSPVTLAATADASGILTFKGTSGLPFSITTPDWLSLTGSTPGTTNGSSQTVGYTASGMNLNSTELSGDITVKAGNIEKTVAVKRSGSTFTVFPTELSFEKTGGSGTVEVEGTNGLPWTVSPSVTTDGITPDIISSEIGNTKQTLTFTATANSFGARSVTFTIAVPGGDHSKTVEVNQAAALTGFIVTIDQNLLQDYYTQMSGDKYTWTTHPPFDADGTDTAPSHGITDVNLSESPTMTGSYSIQIQKGQKTGTSIYSVQQSYCSELDEDGTGWRLPTLIELRAIYNNKEEIESSEGASGFERWYWSSSVYKGDGNNRCIHYFDASRFFFTKTSNNGGSVRCVRDLQNRFR